MFLFDVFNVPFATERHGFITCPLGYNVSQERLSALKAALLSAGDPTHYTFYHVVTQKHAFIKLGMGIMPLQCSQQQNFLNRIHFLTPT
jgi:hypothetical protein